MRPDGAAHGAPASPKPGASTDAGIDSCHIVTLRSAPPMSSIPPTNSLGLDFDAPQPAHSPPETPAQDQPVREKKKPYVNPDRVKTGGPQRVCQTQFTLSPSLIFPLGKIDR